MGEDGATITDIRGSNNATIVGSLPDPTSDQSFYKARTFDGTTMSAVTGDLGNARNAFTAIITHRHDALTSDGLLSSAKSTATSSDFSEVNWMTWAASDEITFYCRRANSTGNFDQLRISPIEAGVGYTTLMQNDGAKMTLLVSGVGLLDTDAALYSSYTETTDQPLHIGKSFQTAAAASTLLDGESGGVLYYKKAIGSDYYPLVEQLKPAHWREYIRVNLGVGAWGDSLTTASFADPSYVKGFATGMGLHDHDLNGVGGETSVSIISRINGTSLADLRRKYTIIFMGNNDGNSAMATAAQNTLDAINRFLLAGNQNILVLGIPNRTVTDATDATIDDRTAYGAQIQAIVKPFCDATPYVTYFDTQDWFVNSDNYTPLDSDDSMDQGKGIVPRSCRDDRFSVASTHFGDIGAAHLAALLLP
jgi:hypothetical protein